MMCPPENFARTTISIPRPLKRRMKQVQAVNWSAVAAAAFRAKLDSLHHEQKAATIQDVVARLKQSEKHVAGDDTYAAGQERGRAWAMQEAALQQFRRLEKFRAKFDAEQWNALFHGISGWQRLARNIDLKSPPAGKRPPMRFWRQLLGHPEMPPPPFFRGFADAALEVWQEVKGQL